MILRALKYLYIQADGFTSHRKIRIELARMFVSMFRAVDNVGEIGITF
jgi:hypothetical protein